MKIEYIEYYVTFHFYDEINDEDEYLTIAEFKTLEESIDFAKKTVGTVEVVASYLHEDGLRSSESDCGEYVHVGFIDGVQQYHDSGP